MLSVSPAHASGVQCVLIRFRVRRQACHRHGCLPGQCDKGPPADRPSPGAKSKAAGWLSVSPRLCCSQRRLGGDGAGAGRQGLWLPKVVTESWDYEASGPDSGLWLWLWARNPDGVPVLFDGAMPSSRQPRGPGSRHRRFTYSGRPGRGRGAAGRSQACLRASVWVRSAPSFFSSWDADLRRRHFLGCVVFLAEGGLSEPELEPASLRSLSSEGAVTATLILLVKASHVGGGRWDCETGTQSTTEGPRGHHRAVCEFLGTI